MNTCTNCQICWLVSHVTSVQPMPNSSAMPAAIRMNVMKSAYPHASCSLTASCPSGRRNECSTLICPSAEYGSARLPATKRFMRDATSSAKAPCKTSRCEALPISRN
eukprot:1384045-Prymnesium_polylepis.3